jgi:hypothetical protein
MRIIEEAGLKSALEIIKSAASLPSEDQVLLVERQVLRAIFRQYLRRFHGSFFTPGWGPDEGKKALLELAGSIRQARGMRSAFRFFLRRTDQNSKNIISPSDARNLLLLFQLAEKEPESPHTPQARPSPRLWGHDAEGVLRDTIKDLKRHEEEALDLLSKTPGDIRLRTKAHVYSHAADLLEDAILRIPLIDEDQEVEEEGKPL